MAEKIAREIMTKDDFQHMNDFKVIIENEKINSKLNSGHTKIVMHMNEKKKLR